MKSNFLGVHKINPFRYLKYSFFGTLIGFVLIVLLVPVGAGENLLVELMDWFFASSVFGWILILFKEKNEGWKTKVLLMGTTSLLSIPFMIVFVLGLYLLWYFITGIPYLAI